MSHFCNKEIRRIVLRSQDLLHSCAVLLVNVNSWICFFQKTPRFLFFRLHLDLMAEYYRHYCDHYPHLQMQKCFKLFLFRLRRQVIINYPPHSITDPKQTPGAGLRPSGVHGGITTPNTSAKRDVFWKYISGNVYILHFCSDRLRRQLKNLTYLILNRPCKCNISELRNFPGKISLGK